MKWYTIAIPQWRKAKAKNVALFDVTVKSGDERFAPYADALWAYKRGEVSDEEYTRLYREKMRSLLLSDPRAFEALLEGEDGIEEKALACYCRAGKFCHRHILLEFMQEVAEDNGIAFEYLGEIV